MRAAVPLALVLGAVLLPLPAVGDVGDVHLLEGTAWFAQPEEGPFVSNACLLPYAEGAVAIVVQEGAPDRAMLSFRGPNFACALAHSCPVVGSAEAGWRSVACPSPQLDWISVVPAAGGAYAVDAGLLGAVWWRLEGRATLSEVP